MKVDASVKKEMKSMENLLMELNLSKNVAKSLACIAFAKEVMSKEIEATTGLRQPEVSISVQELRRMGWVTKRDIKKKGKGRPLHLYRLAIPFSKIVDEIEAREELKLKKIKENIEKLRGFTSQISQEP